MGVGGVSTGVSVKGRWLPMAICAKKIVTGAEKTRLSKGVVAPKVGVTGHAHRNESKNPSGNAGSLASFLQVSGPTA